MPAENEDPNPWAEVLGPCYTVASMGRTLGWTETDVINAGDDIRLLRLQTVDDVYRYPAFQSHNGQVVEGLTQVLRFLQTGTTSRWTWAQWLNTAYHRWGALGGRDAHRRPSRRRASGGPPRSLAWSS